ncbi:hypothetical protein OEZ86_011841 [Tetradesmus obliquus]|nr:hypothetical protein OEZ86_011841 [Tetradesmus obliquus]
MASFQAPPGHLSQAEVLIISSLVEYQLTVNAPDPDLEAPVLAAADGQKVHGTPAIARYVAEAGKRSQLYPKDNPQQLAEVDRWLDVAAALESSAASWVQPTCQQASDEARNAAKASIEQQLAALEQQLQGNSFLVGSVLSLADVAVLCAALPLFSSVLSAEARQPYPALAAWLAATSKDPRFSSVLGDVALCSAEAGWVAPAVAKADKKKKKGKGEEGSQQQQQQAAADAELDPEKAAKKAAKLAEKEAKKAKAAAKAAAAAEKAAAAAGNEKKANKKAEADAKKAAEAAEVQRIMDSLGAVAKGAKKPCDGEMFKSYNPKMVEAAWYDWWEQCGFFKPDMASDKPPFTIVIPPPNVTGALHIGHALTNAVQDTIVRWRRMSGFNVLWVPGTDHAGIATQSVVEKKLQKEQGLSRHDLGREAFLAEVFKWVEEYGGRICSQLRRMGSSVDWERCVFTMDETRSAAVLEAFVAMYESGCVYRDNRLVNWDARLRTAVSDIEVDYIDIPGRTLINVPGYDKPVEFGVLTSFAYPLEDGSGEIVVATTRPETMLGDTAVAVHPEDARYKHLHGKFVVHPVSQRRIPIIADAELVDMEFGTGAVKITPAHDPNDFLVGKRHSLEFINILDDNGNINDIGGSFKGQPRFTARVTVVDFLKEAGLYRGITDNPMRLGISSRSKDVIEPLLKPQWWVACGDMAARSCAAVRSGELEIIPKEFEAVWFRWLENIRDWCISRQLWWGHRIPAYYVTFEGEAPEVSGVPGRPSEDMARWVVGRSREEAAAAAAKKYPGKACTLHQDEDVLDTWFSSGLFPFSVMGWPANTPDMRTFYPGSLLETGHDILFFWVARMVMMGLQLTDKVPFKQVYLHAMVRDAHGKKMSKSLGNVIDPIHVIEGITLQGLHDTLQAGNLDPKEVARAKDTQKTDFPEGIEECGTDALRFALVAYTTQARDINLDIKRVVAYRYWCNKLWNAIKFAMMNLPEAFQPLPQQQLAQQMPAWPPAARWVLSRLNSAVETINKAMEAYDFSTATQTAYAWWQYELCDVFIELMKPVMARDEAADPGAAAAKAATQQALCAALDSGLRLLHPFMPFVTEELWQRLPKTPEQASIPSIMLAPYPTAQPGWSQPELDSRYEQAQAVVAAIRKLRSDYGLTRQRPTVYVACSSAARAEVIQALAGDIACLSTSAEVLLLAADAPLPAYSSVAIVDDVVTVHMVLKGILDPALELAKLEKKQAEAQGRCEAIRKRMGLPAYADKTPAAVQAEDAEKLARAEAEAAAAAQHSEEMRKMIGQ